MIDEKDFETYLNISKDKFEIFLFDKKNLNNFYQDEFKLKNKIDFTNLDNLTYFLDKNIE